MDRDMSTITVRPFAAVKLLLFFAASLLMLAGCDIAGVRGNGNVVTNNRPIGDFSTLEADGAFQVDWAPGAPTLAITTDENLMGYIEVTLNGHKLVLKSHNALRPTHGIKVRAASAQLTGAALHGAVRLNASKLSGTDFYLDATGATRMALDGSMNALHASMAGASRLDADTLHTQTTELSISGAGRADVFATEKLRVEISGAGKVTYSGNPKTVEKKVSGAGSVRPR